MLRKERPIDSGDVILDGKSLKQMPFSATTWQVDIKILPLLSARENLAFYLGLQDAELPAELLKTIKSQFPSLKPMQKMSHSKHKFLRTMIQLYCGDLNLLVLEEPTLGLDQA